ncbi:GD10424 [Drosophila simulans]|uniref:GD10424 n=1 Tax=Drosophila simulans TaxID=7240 RepID=B4QDQ7_DROSI|nr:GD10424 [Drosophila simulans]
MAASQPVCSHLNPRCGRQSAIPFEDDMPGGSAQRGTRNPLLGALERAPFELEPGVSGRSSLIKRKFGNGFQFELPLGLAGDEDSETERLQS